MDRLKKVKSKDLTPPYRTIQGEGIYVGVEQVFIRFSGCNINCKFCDTDNSKKYKYTLESILKRVLSFNKNNIHSISITGGEPLLHIDFLEYLCDLLKKNKFKIYLETNGIMYNNLRHIIKFIDIISMDFKLPSSTGLTSFWNEHLKFLKIASKKDCFVKVVITSETNLKDIKKTVEIISEVNKNIPLVLQPVSINFTGTVLGTQRSWVGGQSPQSTSTSQILKFLKVSKKYLNDVRVIPQIHKLLGLK